MPLKIGFNFRATVGYVTDGTDEEFVDRPDVYPTTIGGVTCGWTDDFSTQERDRDSGSDARLAGLHYYDGTSPVNEDFRIDLDNGGNHDIRLAIGDHAFGGSSSLMQLTDGATVITDIDTGTYSANEWFDATDVKRTSESDWVDNNAKVTHDFSGTDFRAEMQQSCPICHLYVEDVSGGSITGTGALSLPAVTLSGSGDRGVAGTGAFTLPAISLAGSGSAFTVFSGTGAFALPAITLSGTGERVSAGTGACTLGAITLAGTGSAGGVHSGTGALSLPSLELSGTGERIITGSGALTLPAITLSGTGERVSDGTGAWTLGAITLSGTGDRGVVGTGALTLPAVTVSGSGIRGVAGTGVFTLPAITLAGVASLHRTGSGAFTLPAITLAGSGVVGGGYGNLTLPGLRLSGSGIVTRKGPGVFTLPSMSMACQGTVSHTGYVIVSQGLLEEIKLFMRQQGHRREKVTNVDLDDRIKQILNRMGTLEKEFRRLKVGKNGR